MKSDNTTKAILEAGKTGEFWKIIKSELDKDIKKLERQRDDDEFASQPADIYKLAMENIKDRIKHLKQIKKLPQTIIENIDNPIQQQETDKDLEVY